MGLKPLATRVYGLMAVDNFVFYTSLSMINRFSRLVKINSVILKDIAIRNNEQVPLQSMQTTLSYQNDKCRWTDGQTDGFAA